MFLYRFSEPYKHGVWSMAWCVHASQHRIVVVSTAGEAAAANGPPKEPHLPADPGPAGRSRPDRHAEDREDGPGVPAGEHSGRKYSTALCSDALACGMCEREGVPVWCGSKINDFWQTTRRLWGAREEVLTCFLQGSSSWIRTLKVSFIPPLAGCVLPREGENGGYHLPADQAHWFLTGQNGPAHKEKEGGWRGNTLNAH